MAAPDDSLLKPPRAPAPDGTTARPASEGGLSYRQTIDAALGRKPAVGRAETRREPKLRRGSVILREGLRRLARGLGDRGRIVGLVVLALVLCARALDPMPLQVLQMRGFDVLQQLFPRVAQNHPVTIVDLDDESLAAVGQWPWPRTVLAQLIDRLNRAGVAAIGFDVLFAEPDRMSPARVAEALPVLDDATRRTLSALPSNESVMAKALGQGRVVLGQAVQSRELASAAARPPVKTPMAKIGGDPLAYVMNFPSLIRSVPELESSAKGRGLLTIVPEPDGVVRRVPLLLAVGKDLYPTLAVEMLRVATGKSAIAVRSNYAGIESVRVDRMMVPTDEHGRVWVRYAQHEAGIYVSARQVLDGSVDPARLKGKLVLIGTSAIGLQDLKTTPVQDAMPGVEVHAQLLETILDGTFLTRPNWAVGAELTLILAVGLLMVILVPMAGAQWSLALLLIVAGGLAGGSAWLYAGKALMLDGMVANVTAMLLYTVLVYMNYSREESQRRLIRGAFGQYLSPALVEQLANDPNRLKLGGEMREMTFLFCDVRGFTTISEQFKSNPQGLTQLINRFLTPMTDIIMARRGTIDKYMGDCIMAFWNAPLDDPEHADNACRSALAMFAALEKLNADLKAEAERDKRKFYPLNIGIGLNTGECVVGNMGSNQRFDYSVLGDAVNLASRLEGQSKSYGVGIVIGENTRAAAPDWPTLELDLIAVKGKKEAVRIYTLLGEPSMRATAEFQALVVEHDKFLQAYRAQDWTGAMRQLEACSTLAPQLDALYEIYLDRIAHYQASPPGAGWDGVYVATSK